MRQSSSGKHSPGSVLRDEIRQITLSIYQAKKSLSKFSAYFSALEKTFDGKSPRINKQVTQFRIAESLFRTELESFSLVDLETALKDLE